MKITKYGYCCFVAEPKDGVRIMTDPGSFSTSQNEAKDITAIVITHEHSDHLHIDSLKEVLKNNPNAIVITNTGVGRLLDEAGITYTKVEELQSATIAGVVISGFGSKHAEIYGEFGQVQNTGYMIGNLCYPGDAFAHPDIPVDILALPIVGPWMKMKDAIDYAKALKPRICFPVHDAILSDSGSFFWKLPQTILGQSGIEVKNPELNKEEEI